MIQYILEVGFVWLVLYLFYALFLQKERFFAINRSYLLIALIAGLCFPFIEIETTNIYLSQLPILLNEVAVNAEQNINTPAPQGNNWNYMFIWSGVYVIGFLFSLTRFSISLVKIKQLYNDASLENCSAHCLVKTNEVHSPFSFGKYLFISNEIQVNNKEYQYILEHETAHIIQNHTLDILLIEILSILFWFNPLLLFYTTALRDQHEYLADQAVLHHAPIKEYGQLLIEQSIPGLKIGLVNHLIYSQLKKRINMMTKKHSLKIPYLRYATSIAAFFLVFWTVSCQKDTNEQTTEVFTVVEEMPYLISAACEGKIGKERKECSDTELLRFVYDNVTYPKAAQENGTEGMAVVSFVITTEGDVTSIKTVRDPGDGCGAEAARIVELMKTKRIEWAPGRQKGKIVAVKYNLPIRFKLK